MHHHLTSSFLTLPFALVAQGPILAQELNLPRADRDIQYSHYLTYDYPMKQVVEVR